MKDNSVEITYTDGDGMHSIWFMGKGILVYLVEEEWKDLMTAIEEKSNE